MEILLSILFCIVGVLLLIVMGVRPQEQTHSTFELRRRKQKGDKEAEYLLRRNELLHDVFSLQRVVTALLLVILSAISVELFYWLLGLVITLLIALEAGAVARLSLLQHRSQKLYQAVEPKLLAIIERYPLIFKMIRSVSPVPADTYDIESREELLHMIEQSGGVLRANEKKMITNALNFDERTVSEIMVSRSNVTMISADEVLGPLVVNDLYSTGYTRFPVYGDSIDDIVGVIYLEQLMKIDGAKTATTKTAHQMMERRVYYIREDQSLQHALSAFLRMHHHLFVVLNEHRETVGIVTLEDCLGALLGRKIHDEFDQHDNRSVVAGRVLAKNNHSKNGQEV